MDLHGFQLPPVNARQTSIVWTTPDVQRSQEAAILWLKRFGECKDRKITGLSQDKKTKRKKRYIGQAGFTRDS